MSALPAFLYASGATKNLSKTYPRHCNGQLPSLTAHLPCSFWRPLGDQRELTDRCNPVDNGLLRLHPVPTEPYSQVVSQCRPQTGPPQLKPVVCWNVIATSSTICPSVKPRPPRRHVHGASKHAKLLPEDSFQQAQRSSFDLPDALVDAWHAASWAGPPHLALACRSCMQHFCQGPVIQEETPYTPCPRGLAILAVVDRYCCRSHC